MNKYLHIVNWLREKDYISWAISTSGSSVLIDSETREEVATARVFMLASILPTAKKMIMKELRDNGIREIKFTEEYIIDKNQWEAFIIGDGYAIEHGTGDGGDEALYEAIVSYALNTRGRNG
jgi:hypothetical protein